MPWWSYQISCSKPLKKQMKRNHSLNMLVKSFEILKKQSKKKLEQVQWRGEYLQLRKKLKLRDCH